MDLAAVPWRTTRYPGVAIHFYASDKASGRVLALIRMEPGCGYPEHRHHGEEHVLVLQGGYQDAQGDHRAGSFVVYEDRSVHAPTALPGGEACVLLALAHEGIRLLGA
jgi:anti-sigma factor ChrR (cupin superfamily)